MIKTTHNNSKRLGFTLIELLMVVTIIAVLTSMTLVVMNGITDNAKEAATKTTVLKVSRMLDQRMEAYERAFRGARRDQYVQATVGLLSSIDARFDYFNQFPDEAPPAIRLLAYKAGFRFEVPQRMSDLGAGAGALPSIINSKLATPIARQQLIDEGIASPTNAEITAKVTANWAVHTAHEVQAALNDIDSVHSTESSELLYFMLTRWGTLGTSSANEDQFTSAEIEDTDQDGFPEFVDGWGNPLRFYRWPTRLIDPDAPVFDIFPYDANSDGAITGTEGTTAIPLFSDPNDASETRVVQGTERDYAGLLLKGLPPVPTVIPNTYGQSSTQRDLLLVDPDDPVGILYTFLEDPAYRSKGVYLLNHFNETNYHTPDTYHAPLIVSGGPDERMGLREPSDVNGALGIYGNLAQYAGTTTGASAPNSQVFDSLQDNITNRNRRAGARR
jgi:prepilin-type N-terminal cleavage/methylation domain-containing protein